MRRTGTCGGSGESAVDLLFVLVGLLSRDAYLSQQAWTWVLHMAWPACHSRRGGCPCDAGGRYRFGVCLVLLCWVLWNAIFDPSVGINLFDHPIISLYMCTGGESFSDCPVNLRPND